MKVRSVTLSGFGALSGRFELDEEMTVVGGPNESGKSTLHTALRLALCGVDLPARGRMPKDTEEVLRRYRPWGGGAFTVEAEVELDGGRYRFVRDLSQPDSAQVFDLIKGGDVTQQFRRGRNVDVAAGLQMSREAFLAVSTVAQDQILALSGTALQEDLQRASATSGTDATARAAIDRLERWRQERIRGDRTTSKPLDAKQKPKELEDARTALDHSLEVRRQLAEDLGSRETLQWEQDQAELQTRSAEVAWKSAELTEIQQDLGAVADIDQQLAASPEPRVPKDPATLRDAATGARNLAKEWQEAEAKLAELTPPEPGLERLSRDSHPTELAFLVGALEQPLPPLPPESDIPDRLALLDRRRISSVRWSSDVLALLGGVAGVFLIVFGIVDGGLARILLVAGGLVLLVITGTLFWGLQRRLRRLLAVGGFTSIREMRRAEGTVDPELARTVAAREKVEGERTQARKRLSELGMPTAEVPELKQLAERLPAAQSSLQERLSWSTTAKRFREELVARAKRVGISGDDPVKLATELSSKLRELDQAEDTSRRRVELQARRTERLGGRDPKALGKRAKQLSEEMVGLDAGRDHKEEKLPSEELRHRYDEAVRRRDEVRGQLLPLQGRLHEQLKEAGDVAAMEERVAAVAEEVARLERAEAAVKLAISELERAESLIHNDLAPQLADGLNLWLARLTGERYRRAWVDPRGLQMHVAAQDSGVQIRVEDLSQGTREQIYVALRTVLARALSPKVVPVPLFFDDPCVSADDLRCTALLETLRELAKETQVVVFSHESRVGNWASRSKVPILSMKVVPAWGGPEGAAAPSLPEPEGA